MSLPLYIQQGPSPTWWLSPAIWVTAEGDPSSGPQVANPVVGKPYSVWVEVQNLYPDPYDGGWDLFVCWGTPFTGALPSVNIGQILNGSMTAAGPQGAAIVGTIPAGTATTPGIAVLQAATSWTPVLENGGHECLVAAVYDEQDIGGLATSTLLDGDAAWTQTYSVAQRNLSVVQSMGGKRHFPFHFEVWNDADQARDFSITAWQAPLKGIETLLPFVHGHRVLERPGKVERLSIVAEVKADAVELEKAAASHGPVRIPARSSKPFTLGISLSRGNALIHVTQSLDGRIVGGLSVLAMAD